MLDVRDLPQGGCTRTVPNRTVLGILNHDGAFADLIAVPQRNLHAVPDSLSDDIAVFTEPVAAAFQIPAQMSIRAQDRIIVLGDGRLGNLCAQVLARLSNHVLVVGKHPQKLALLADAWHRHGAGIGSDRRALGGHRRGLHGIGDRPADGAEAGAAARNDRAEDHRGRHADAGLGALRDRRGHAVGSQVWSVRSGARPRSSRGEVSVQPLISERYDLAKGIEALERAQAKSVLKVLLERSRRA